MMKPTTYFPRHFRQTRPYVKQLGERLDQLAQTKQLTFRTAEEASCSLIAAHYKPMGLHLDSPDFDIQRFTQEVQSALIYSEWANMGSIIYEFDPKLSEELGQSALGDICFADIPLPFHCAYFHFGPQAGLTLQNGAPITGAYLTCSPEISMRVTLTAPLSEIVPWPERNKEIYDLRVRAEHFGIDLDTALDLALTEDVAELRRMLNRSDTDFSPAFLERSHQAIQSMIDYQTANYEAYRKALQLLINGLCYITSYPEDVRSGWQDSTPEKLRKQAEAGSDKEKARARSKLNGLGYSRVRYVGRGFGLASEYGVGYTPHWRRGHWRNQAYGTGRAEHKLIWIRPTRVLGGANEDRVYQIKGEE